jgi:hypothetical protein
MDNQQQIIFSDDLRYRYSFYQKWNDNESIMFVGLNPSLSEGLNPTLNKCIALAKVWGFGSCYILNLFAARAKTPNDLRKLSEPIGDENDQWLQKTSKLVAKVVFAWGTHGNFLDRDFVISKMFPDAYCLGKTKDGFPKHPLYLRSDTSLVLFHP